MQIRTVKSRRGESLFLFEFEDEQEKNVWIDMWRNAAKKAAHPKCFDEALDSLESRIDGKYGTEEYQLSGMLFEHEFVNYTMGLIAILYSKELQEIPE